MTQSLNGSGLSANLRRHLLPRYRGSLLGLAVGDALGTALEFKQPGTFEPIDDMIGGGPFDLKAGEWTDDTSMALCLAESLIETKRFDPQDQLKRYLKWHDHGHLSSNGRCFDIGNTVRHALETFRTTHMSYCGPVDSRSAGNGSIMRLVPVPLFFSSNPALAIQNSGQSSRTTHGARVCIDACRYMGGLLVGAISGATKEEVLSELYDPIAGYWEQNPLVEEIAEIARGSFKHREPPTIKGTGYVVKSLEAALWAFHKTDSFRDGCLLAVNLGNDADTTGAVYGQIAGAFYGEEGIPRAWRHKLAHRALIESLADQLFSLSQGLAP